MDIAAQQPGSHAVAPLDDFVLGLIVRTDLFLGRKITKANIQEVLRESDELTHEILDWRFKKSQQARKAGL